MVSISVRSVSATSCELIHGEGAAVKTAAPRDIGGEGGSVGFSPTDMVAGGLAACVLTTMAMFAKRHGLDLTGATAGVEKHMTVPPDQRRIARLPVAVTFPADVTQRIPMEMRGRIEAAGNACPVHASLHPEVEAPIVYVWQEG